MKPVSADNPTDGRSPSPAGADADRFRPIRFHARGGLGEVLLAEDAQLRRSVALKRILPEHSARPSARARFLREAEITGSLDHPGVVPVYGLGADPDGRPYYAMRFVAGRSMREAIAEFHRAAWPDPGRRTVAFRKLLSSFVSVCQTVAYAHSRGVLHRDLKPANVMLGEYGETLVVDWGLAKSTASGGAFGAVSAGGVDPAAGSDPDAPTEVSGSSADGSFPEDRTDANAGSSVGYGTVPGTGPVPGADSTVAATPPPSRAGRLGAAGGAELTDEGARLGTPGFMAPEQCRGGSAGVGPAADVYALGAILFHLLTGRPPHDGLSSAEKMMRTVTGTLPRPRSLMPDVPAALEAVCLKAMAVEPADRHPDAARLAADVEAYLADEPVSAWREPAAVRVGRWVRRRRSLVFSAAAALAAAGLSAAAGLVMLRGKNAELTAERDRAVLAEAEAVRLRERAEGALAGEAEARRLADGQRKAAESALATAESALRTAEARLALARQAVDRCFEIAEGHPLLQAPGMDEVRELLRRTAVDFRDRIAATGGGFAVRREAAAARFRAARETASLKGKPEAIRLYREVIAELVPLIRDDPGDVDLRMNLATARENLGNLLQQAGDRAAALDEFRWAVAARVEEMRTTGRKPWLMDALANSRTILGNALRETDPQAALAEHRAALAIRLGLTTLEDSERRARPGRFPGADNFGWAGVVQSRNAIGSVLGDIGDADGALREFGAALAVAAGTLRLAPTYAAHRAQLAAAYHGLGVTLESKGDPRAAAEAYRGALAVGEALVAGNPAVVEFRRALSDSRNNLGILLEELGDRAGALRELRATLEIRRRLAADSPTVVEFRRGLGSSHHNLGSLLGDAGEAAASLREFRDALAVRARLASEFPAEPALRRDLSNTFAPMAIAHQSAGRLPQTARCLDRRNAAAVAVPNPGGRPDPRPLFDAACTVAGFIPSVAEGERDEWAAVATALLRDAMSAGSADAAAARRNPDLAPLRDRPDFKALMLEWENPLRTPKPRAK